MGWYIVTGGEVTVFYRLPRARIEPGRDKPTLYICGCESRLVQQTNTNVIICIMHSICKDSRLARIELALELVFCNTRILNHTPELNLHPVI